MAMPGGPGPPLRVLAKPVRSPPESPIADLRYINRDDADRSGRITPVAFVLGGSSQPVAIGRMNSRIALFDLNRRSCIRCSQIVAAESAMPLARRSFPRRNETHPVCRVRSGGRLRLSLPRYPSMHRAPTASKQNALHRTDEGQQSTHYVTTISIGRGAAAERLCPNQAGTHLTVSSVQCVVVDFGHGNEVSPPHRALCERLTTRGDCREGRHSQSSCR